MPCMERQLYSGDLMVWEAGARLPGAPPAEYGPVAMGPASMAAMPQGCTHLHQVNDCGSRSVQLPAPRTRRQEEVKILRISPLMIAACMSAWAVCLALQDCCHLHSLFQSCAGVSNTWFVVKKLASTYSLTAW